MGTTLMSEIKERWHKTHTELSKPVRPMKSWHNSIINCMEEVSLYFMLLHLYYAVVVHGNEGEFSSYLKCFSLKSCILCALDISHNPMKKQALHSVVDAKSAASILLRVGMLKCINMAVRGTICRTLYT